MTKIFFTVIEGVIAFAATNIDDLVVLLLFFTQVNAKFRPHHVVSGTYWGFTAIVALSLVGFFGGLLISPEWIGLLGILPIGIGLHKLIQREPDQSEIQAVSPERIAQSHRYPFAAFLMQLLHPQSYQVAAVTLANGSDNIGVYVPLFAAKDTIGLGIILIVFYLLLGGLCYAAYRLTQNSKIAYFLDQHSDSIVPVVFIGLGLFILWEKGTLNLLIKG